MKCNQSRPGCELESPCSFPTTITTTSRAPRANTSKGICPKVNVIARLEYELADYDSAVHRFNHNNTRTSPNCKEYSAVLLLILPSLASNSQDRRHNWHIYIGTVINEVIRILLTTFPTHFTPSTIILMTAIFMAFVTLQWFGYCISRSSLLYYQLLFFGCLGGVKIHYACIRLYCFPFFFNRYSFLFNHTLLL